MKTEIGNTPEVVAGDGSSPSSCSDFWAVRFKTRDGQYHPIWYGKRGGKQIPRSTIEALAQNYLEDNKHWLSKIDEIHIPTYR